MSIRERAVPDRRDETRPVHLPLPVETTAEGDEDARARDAAREALIKFGRGG